MRSFSISLLFLGALAVPAICQQPGVNDTADDTANETGGKRILWIIPNFRTSPTLAQYKPLTVREKLVIASEDSFDRGTVALAALFAGDGQLTDSNPSFGQGVKGYARYFGTAYGDFVVGDFMTEGIFPSFLHQDPRYFRRGRGSFKSRLAYSAGQIFLTHGDSGRTQFNFSEVLGNSAAVGVSMAWYPDNRNVGDAVSKLGVQLGVDMASNILKEFVPDVTRRFSRKHTGQR
ncbi:MAG TPA: hypothetical protein VG297_11365 [Bryobacteraceae bacterium]|jgi:hypothetical protein|nr:hypothetical protein [Bryobacteraceae bacterium]